VVLVNQHEPVPGATAAQWCHQAFNAAKQELKSRYEEMKRMELGHLPNELAGA
jgi:hypothetical protein